MTSLRCQVTSAWHVEVEPAGCAVHRMLHIDGSDLVLCAYGRAGGRNRAQTGRMSEMATETNELGVLVVDARDGTIRDTACFSAVSLGESVLWLTAVRCVDAPEHVEADGPLTVACVTSAGCLWRFRVSRAGSIVSDIIRSQALLDGLASEDSPMEDLVLAMKTMNAPSALKKNATEVRLSAQSSQSDTSMPAFIAENGYRGARSGYSYWGGNDGDHHDGRPRYAPGYYRSDVMRDIIAAERQHERNTVEIQNKSSEAQHTGKKNLLRCFLHLPKVSKFVACSQQPEDGMLTVGTIDLKTVFEANVDAKIDSESFVSNLDGLIGHMSGVLVLAASPDEKYVASGSYDQTIRVYDTASWRCIKVLKGHGGGIKCLNFSDDGTQLISAASDNTTRVWSTATWMCMRQLHGRHEDTTWPVCQEWISRVDEEPENVDHHKSDDSNVKSHKNNDTRSGQAKQHLLISGSNGLFGGSTLKIFDVTSGNCLSTFAQLRFDHKGSCSAVCFVRGNKALRVMTAATDASLAGWICKIFHEEKKPLLTKGFFG